MTTPSDVLIVESIADGAYRLVLNRPDARNALNRELRLRLAQTFRDLRDHCRVVILTGAGRAFCSGFDLAELAAGSAGADAAEAGADIGRELIPAIANFPGAIVAAVNGPAVTAGFELALACDFIIASTEAKFADTHVRVGILPGWGLSQRLPRLIGINRAKEMAFTGNFLDAATASQWGLVNRVVAPEDLGAKSERLAADILSGNPASLRAYKRLIDRGYGMSFDEAVAMEADAAIGSARSLTSTDADERKGAVVQRGRKQTRETRD